jgi:hypothetical protein
MSVGTGERPARREEITPMTKGLPDDDDEEDAIPATATTTTATTKLN